MARSSIISLACILLGLTSCKNDTNADSIDRARINESSFGCEDGGETVLMNELKDKHSLLVALRHNLDIVRNAKPDEVVQLSRVEPIDLLDGLTIIEIKSILGQPDDPINNCSEKSYCIRYRFHHLPPRSLGGGLELEVLYNKEGVCRSAYWKVSM